MVHFNPDLPVKLVCDASNDGIGAVLLHVFLDGSEKPICFASRTLSKAEKNYATIHKEALAIYWRVQKFYQHLLRIEFILQSDHMPLNALFGEEKGILQMAAGRLQRWALFLSPFKYKFQYIKGTQNAGADRLSRLPLVEKNVREEASDYFHFLVEEKSPISSIKLDVKLE